MEVVDLKGIFHEHGSAVFGFAYRMTGSRESAEDIAQEVFVSLVRKPNGFDANRGSMRAYLLGVARNVTRKKWRHEGRWGPAGRGTAQHASVQWRKPRNLGYGRSSRDRAPATAARSPRPR